MKQKLKLALVGAGERGQYCYAPYAKMHGYEIEFVAVADPHKGRREKFVQDYHVPAEGVFETAEQFFARPRMADAVLICTQDSQHYAYACQAIDLGYSILLEKPISPSVRECLDLQRRAEEKGTQIMVCLPQAQGADRLRRHRRRGARHPYRERGLLALRAQLCTRQLA